MEFNGVDLPVLYLLMGILIFLALMAALGTWVRGGGLKREDAEDLFNSAQERNRDELLRIEKAFEESRTASAQTQAKHQEDINLRLRELESTLAKVAREHGDTLSSGMESVERMVDESERRTTQQVDKVISNLESLDQQVRKAGEQVTITLEEIARQQREQKAQSTIQLCDALITSLGTLKTSISNQLTHTGDVHTVDSEEVKSNDYALPEAAPAQWPSAEKDVQQPDNDPFIKPFESAFGADADHHDDEEEYPLPVDGGSDSFASTSTISPSGDATADAARFNLLDDSNSDQSSLNEDDTQPEQAEKL